MNWKEWLNSEECFPVLERAASRVLQHKRHLDLPRSLSSDSDDRAGQDSGGARTSSQDMVNTLWLYAMKQADVWEVRHAFDVLSAQGTPRLVAFVVTRYLRYLQDSARTHAGHPAKALYRRLRQCLQNHDGVQYRLRSGYAAYACADAGSPVEIEADGPLPVPESYRRWPPPNPSFHLSPGVLTKDIVITWACQFWREAERRLGKPCWIPVRELARYLMAHLPMELSEREVLFSDLSPAENEEEPDRDFEIAVHAPQEKELVRHDLPRLARTLVASWDARERTAFYAKYALDWKLADIAKITGHRGASGARHLLEQLTLRIHDFCLLWSGLPSWDEDRDLAADFLYELLHACKSDWESRKHLLKGSAKSD